MIYTGSSALELESNTDATRRMKIERIYPMNFREYLLLARGIKISENDFNKVLFNAMMKIYKKCMILKSHCIKKWHN